MWKRLLLEYAMVIVIVILGLIVMGLLEEPCATDSQCLEHCESRDASCDGGPSE